MSETYDELRAFALHLEQGGDAPSEMIAAAWAAADAAAPACGCSQADCPECSPTSEASL
jgi:hypothetical protein